MTRLDYAVDAVRPALKARLMLTAPSGAGKAQPTDTLLPTPSGHRKIGDLRTGDQVFGSDGRPTVVTGVFPQGERQVYRVGFDDGTSTEACVEHLWPVRNRWGTQRVLATSELRPREHSIPLVSAPLEFPDGDLPVEPYLLGVLLGDGYLGDGRIGLSTDTWIVEATGDDLLSLGARAVHRADTNDPAVAHYEITKDGNMGRPFMLLDVLRDLGLAGKLAADKLVPEQYLSASAGQRHALVQGLLDSDGWFNGPSVEWSTVSPKLAEGMSWLVESLGGRFWIKRRLSGYVGKAGVRVATQDHYRCRVQLPPGMLPGRLPRKMQRFTERLDHRWGWRHLREVEATRTAECVCIAVEAPDHLYLTEHAIVTHNTRTALIVAEQMVIHDLYGGDRDAYEAVDLATRRSHILFIDTEKESALTYADDYAFRHLRWIAPFDPRELATTLAAAGRGTHVVIVDSLTHFWHGSGGTLDIAAGKFTGWSVARPAQEDLVEAIVSNPAHVITCVRSKQEYLVSEDEKGKQKVEKAGMGPRQDDQIEYELNVAAELDMRHRLTITKSRTTALQVGSYFHSGHAADMGRVYAEWLAGGEPPAAQADVAEIVAGLEVLEEPHRRAAKAEFVAAIGKPDHLTEAKLPLARALVAKWTEMAAAGAPVPPMAGVAANGSENGGCAACEGTGQKRLASGSRIPCPACQGVPADA